MNKRLLIVVDMQNDFVFGSLANPMAEAIIPNIIKEMDASDCVIFIVSKSIILFFNLFFIVNY